MRFINDALRYILYSINVDDLYNAALSTYDVDLVLIVAERSQRVLCIYSNNNINV
jgi:elongator complex protein 1